MPPNTPTPRQVEPQQAIPKKLQVKRSIRAALEMLNHGKWLMLGVCAFVVIGAVAYTASLPEQYAARTLLLINTEEPLPSSNDDALTYGYLEGPSPISRNLYTQVLLLERSHAIAQSVADELHAMQTLPETGNPLPILSSEGAPLSIHDVSERLREYINIEFVNRNVDALWVVATSPSPQEAALIADLYAEAYVQNVQNASRQRITSSRRFLEEQTAQRREDLRELEAQMEAYMSREGAVALDQEAENTIAQIAQLDASLDEAQVELSLRRAALESLEQEQRKIQPKLAQRVASDVESEIILTQEKIAELKLKVEPINNLALQNEAASRTGLILLNEQIAKLEQHLQGLAAQYAEELLAVGGADLSAEGEGVPYLAQLSRQVVDERIAISGTEAKIEALKQRLVSYRQKLRTIPEQSMELAQLQRARQSTEQLYMSLGGKLQEARIAEKSEIGFAQIVSPAQVPETPTAPQTRRNLALGLLLGLSLGIGVAFVRYKLDARIYTPDDLQSFSADAVYTIPDMRPLIRHEFGKKDRIEVEGRMVRTTLVSILSPFSPAAESFIRLYIGLQFSRPDRVTETVLITSPEAEAGKSTTALNLALTAARSGRRTLLIDADLRRPSVHSYLGVSSTVSLPDLLRDSGRTVQMADLRSGIENVYVLTTNEPLKEATGLLRSKALRDLLEQFRAGFDLIVLDSPPVLIATDAVLLASQCDVTLVVAGAGRTDADALRQSIRELEEVGGHVAGVVLNRFDPTYTYGYKHTYGYRYGQYEYEKERALT